MSIGKLEPLYRYLKTIGQAEPVARFISDIDRLAKGGYVGNASDGVIMIRETEKTTAELDKILAQLIPSRIAHHMMYQAIGKEMFLSLSRVSENVSKTALALCITEQDKVVVDYLEHRALFCSELMGQVLWNSISTVVVDDAGASKRGFIRAETTFMPNSEHDSMGIKCDFKLSRTKPFYVLLRDCKSSTPVGTFGPVAKEAFEQLESAWKA